MMSLYRFVWKLFYVTMLLFFGSGVLVVFSLLSMNIFLIFTVVFIIHIFMLLVIPPNSEDYGIAD